MSTGIRGRVIKKRGNLMPGIDVNRAATASNALSQAEVVVFKSDSIKPSEFKTLDQAKSSPDFVKVVTTDSEGQYEVTGLEGGQRYTVVANIGGRLYLNLFDSLNNWSSVETVQGEFATFDIEDTSEAFF